MPELLLEVGCEELPASSVPLAVDDLREAVLARLREARLEAGVPTTYATPRRLIVSIGDVSARQPDVEQDVRGPSAQAAYDADGKPTKALEGFCRGQGVDPAAARVEGEYVYVTKAVAGKPAEEVLAALLPEAIRSLTFSKTMRWGSYRMRFARPIRWILAAFAGRAVPFTLEGVSSGLHSRGHRFNFPAPFEAATVEALVAGLRERGVEPDQHVRVTLIREGARAQVSDGAVVEIDEDLVVENAFLTESPEAVLGEFDSRYLELPEPVLVTVMAKHERFFPVRERFEGPLRNKFVSIKNGGVAAVVAEGNAWVLNARFNDAKFFFDEDKKRTLDDFLEQTEGIVFQADLGTVRQRADRLARLCEAVANSTGADADEIACARQAGHYAKADLSTGLVGELAELQGVVGGIYARREGFPDAVCWAIHSHYEPAKNPEPNCPGARTALRLTLADQLDKLAGYLGLGLVPSGSSDPFGLRRAAGMAMEIALEWDSIDLGDLLGEARDGYERELANPVPAARDLFRQRCETTFGADRSDVLEAVLSDPDLVFRPATLRRRLELVRVLARDPSFVRAATRPLNIVAAAERKGLGVLGSAQRRSVQPEESHLNLLAAILLRPGTARAHDMTFLCELHRDNLAELLAVPLAPVKQETRFLYSARLHSVAAKAESRCAPLPVLLARSHLPKYVVEWVWFAAHENRRDYPSVLLEAAQILTGEVTTWQAALRIVQEAIDAFFDSTMVMVDDPAVRDARLAMLREVCEVLLRVGDFSKLVIPG